MNKRCACITFLFLATALYAALNETGFRGLTFVNSALTERIGHFEFISGLSGHLAERKAQGISGFADVVYGINISPFEFLSLRALGVYKIDAMETIENIEGSGRASYGPGDTKIGVKFVPSALVRSTNPEYPRYLDFMEIGLMLDIIIPTGSERGAPHPYGSDTSFIGGKPYRFNSGGIHRFYTAGGFGFSPLFCITGKFPTTYPAFAHLNIGYNYVFGSIGELVFGIGSEVNYPGFTPYFEIFGTWRTYSKYQDGGIFLNLGFRFAPTENTIFTLAPSLRLADFSGVIWEPGDTRYHIQRGWGHNPPWAVHLSYSQGFDVFKPAPPKGVIKGAVVDAVTQEPVKAVIIFPDLDTAVMTVRKDIYDEKDRLYKLSDSPEEEQFMIEVVTPITTLMRVRAKRYVTRDTVISLGPGEKAIVNIELRRKKPKLSVLTGTIVDKETGELIKNATISFPETNIKPVKVKNGIFKIKLKPETYVIKVEAPGYIPCLLYTSPSPRD